MDSNPTTAIAEFLIADFEREIPTTLRLLGAVPVTPLDYAPDAKAKTALGLLRHLALEDAWLLDCIAAGAFTAPPDDSDACGIMTPADAAARYNELVPASLARVRALSGDQLSAILDLFGIVQAPAVAFIAMALKHSIHHRGQLSTYIRPMGGKIPGIYGPSADTQ